MRMKVLAFGVAEGRSSWISNLYNEASFSVHVHESQWNRDHVLAFLRGQVPEPDLPSRHLRIDVYLGVVEQGAQSSP